MVTRLKPEVLSVWVQQSAAVGGAGVESECPSRSRRPLSVCHSIGCQSVMGAIQGEHVNQHCSQRPACASGVPAFSRLQIELPPDTQTGPGCLGIVQIGRC